MDAPIGGTCESRFSAVREEFAGNFADRGEVGAGVCVMIDGRVVVDLVGGWADEDRQHPWQPDTLVNFYSVGKPIVALLALQLVDAGLIGLFSGIEVPRGRGRRPVGQPFLPLDGDCGGNGYIGGVPAEPVPSFRQPYSPHLTEWPKWNRCCGQ